MLFICWINLWRKIFQLRGLDPCLTNIITPFWEWLLISFQHCIFLKIHFSLQYFSQYDGLALTPLHLADPGKKMLFSNSHFFWMFLAIVLIVAIVNKSHSCHFPFLTSALGEEKRKEERKSLKGEWHFSHLLLMVREFIEVLFLTGWFQLQFKPSMRSESEPGSDYDRGGLPKTLSQFQLHQLPSQLPVFVDCCQTSLLD